MTTYCPNSEAAHAHLDDEERRERIGQRAEEILKEMIDEAMGDKAKLTDVLEDYCGDGDLKDLIVNAIQANSIGRLHNDVEGLLRFMWREKAIAQAESEG